MNIGSYSLLFFFENLIPCCVPGLLRRGAVQLTNGARGLLVKNKKEAKSREIFAKEKESYSRGPRLRKPVVEWFNPEQPLQWAVGDDLRFDEKET